MGRIPTGDRETLGIADEETDYLLCSIGDAELADVAKVIFADPHDGDGRSQWVWLRLANGDLFLAVAPQGETYFATERGHTA